MESVSRFVDGGLQTRVEMDGDVAGQRPDVIEFAERGGQERGFTSRHAEAPQITPRELFSRVGYHLAGQRAAMHRQDQTTVASAAL